MSFFRFVLFAGVSLSLLSACSGTPNPSSDHPSMSDSSLSTAALAERFRAYRAGLRDGSSMQDPASRAWSGPVHSLMAELGERLGTPRPVEEVVSLLGEPDEVLPAGHRRMGVAVPEESEHLVYWWRGRHDCLYFVASGGRIRSSSWFHALE